KACVGKLTVGSNPTPSASDTKDPAAPVGSSSFSPPAAPAVVVGRRGCRAVLRCRAMDELEAMDRALALAAEAAAAGEVPVGAVVLVGGEVVAARRNEREATGDPTAHAEVLALRDAAAAIGERRLHQA